MRRPVLLGSKSLSVLGGAVRAWRWTDPPAPVLVSGDPGLLAAVEAGVVAVLAGPADGAE